ncbi:MAG: DUF1571 domain-containing protein [Bacteroidia bacterium]|jgi:hypothetical protein
MNLKRFFLVVFFLPSLSILLLTSFSLPKHTTGTNSLEMLNSILKAITEIKTMRYELHRNERVKGKMSYTESKVKMQVSPRKLYISLGAQEVLWVEGTNGGNALVNPGSFPYVNVNLDPMGSIMRKNQHHTIHELGMVYFGDILKRGIKRYGTSLDKYFVLLGEEKYMDRACYKLSISFSDFAWGAYTVQKGETVVTIAKKMNLSEFMILEKNPTLDWYDDVKEGQVIQIPNVYAKTILLMIDKEHMLPISEKIFDDQGLFESYEYHQLKVNPVIAPEEFTKDYKDYNF